MYGTDVVFAVVGSNVEGLHSCVGVIIVGGVGFVVDLAEVELLLTDFSDDAVVLVKCGTVENELTPVDGNDVPPCELVVAGVDVIVELILGDSDVELILVDFSNDAVVPLKCTIVESKLTRVDGSDVTVCDFAVVVSHGVWVSFSDGVEKEIVVAGGVVDAVVAD